MICSPDSPDNGHCQERVCSSSEPPRIADHCVLGPSHCTCRYPAARRCDASVCRARACRYRREATAPIICVLHADTLLPDDAVAVIRRVLAEPGTPNPGFSEPTVRRGLSAGGSRIRTLGPPLHARAWILPDPPLEGSGFE